MLGPHEMEVIVGSALGCELAAAGSMARRHSISSGGLRRFATSCGEVTPRSSRSPGAEALETQATAPRGPRNLSHPLPRGNPGTSVEGGAPTTHHETRGRSVL